MTDAESSPTLGCSHIHTNVQASDTFIICADEPKEILKQQLGGLSDFEAKGAVRGWNTCVGYQRRPCASVIGNMQKEKYDR